MPLLVSGVFGNEVKVFSADDEGSVHLCADDGASQDTAADGDIANEGALLVCSEAGQLIFGLDFNYPVAAARTSLYDKPVCLESPIAHVETSPDPPLKPVPPLRTTSNRYALD